MGENMIDKLTEKVIRVVYLIALIVIALDMLYWRPN
jgi:hypothetical protein